MRMLTFTFKTYIFLKFLTKFVLDVYTALYKAHSKTELA